MADKWIQKAIKHPGALTRQAKAAHMTLARFEESVLENPEDYSATTRRRVNLAKTLKKLH